MTARDLEEMGNTRLTHVCTVDDEGDVVHYLVRTHPVTGRDRLKELMSGGLGVGKMRVVAYPLFSAPEDGSRFAYADEERMDDEYMEHRLDDEDMALAIHDDVVRTCEAGLMASYVCVLRDEIDDVQEGEVQ